MTVTKSDFSEMLERSLIGENKRGSEKKEVETVSTEMILRKSTIMGNGELCLCCQGRGFCFKTGDIAACLDAYRNHLLERTEPVVWGRKGKAAGAKFLKR